MLVFLAAEGGEQFKLNQFLYAFIKLNTTSEKDLGGFFFQRHSNPYRINCKRIYVKVYPQLP